MAITSTGGYVGRFYWMNSGIHPDFLRWGSVHFIPKSILHDPFGLWAGIFPVIRQIINWRFYE
jgi:hypothetical protein